MAAYYSAKVNSYGTIKLYNLKKLKERIKLKLISFCFHFCTQNILDL